MQKPSKKSLIVLVCIAALPLALLVYFFGYLYLANRLITKPIFTAEKYNRLYDWDLPQHILNQDVDGDGKHDLVSFTGCAFLSTAKSEQISDDRRCDAEGITALDKSMSNVGQSYLKYPVTDYTLGQNGFYSQIGFYYAYSFLDSESNRFFVVQQGFLDTPQTMRIHPDGHLEVVATPLIHQVQVLLYKISVILLMPLFYGLRLLIP